VTLSVGYVGYIISDDKVICGKNLTEAVVARRD
jgi:hypothetical protein